MLKINDVYNLECLDFLKVIDDTSIDLAVLDPPYNMHKSDWDTFPDTASFLSFTYRWIDELLPKLKPNGSLYIFNTPFNSAFILQYLVSKNMIFQNWITWDKRDGLGSAKRKFSNGQETILFFTKSNKHTFNYDDVRVPYESTSRINHAKVKGILKNGKRWFPNAKGRYCGEVWHISSERHKTKINGKVQKLEHLTPKPLDLIERIIIASSNEGDLVLDCFVGSGTTALAAKKLNRNYLCNDNNISFVELTKNRLDNNVNS